MQQRSYYLHSNRDTLPGPPCPQVARAAWKSRLAPRDPEGGAGIGGARGPEACGRAKAGAEGRRGGPQPRVLAPGRGRAQVRPRASGFTETARLWGSARRGSRQGGRECLSFPSARGARVSRPFPARPASGLREGCEVRARRGCWGPPCCWRPLPRGITPSEVSIDPLKEEASLVRLMAHRQALGKELQWNQAFPWMSFLLPFSLEN